MCPRAEPSDNIRTPLEEGVPNASENEEEILINFDEMEPLNDDDWEDEEDSLGEQPSNDNSNVTYRHGISADRDRSNEANEATPPRELRNPLEQIDQPAPQSNEAAVQAMEQMIWNNLASLTYQTLILPILQQQLCRSASLLCMQHQPFGTIPNINIPGFLAFLLGPQFASFFLTLNSHEQQQQNQLLVLITAQLAAIHQQLAQRNAAAQGPISERPNTNAARQVSACELPNVAAPNVFHASTGQPQLAAQMPAAQNFGESSTATLTASVQFAAPPWFSLLLSLFCAAVTQQWYLPLSAPAADPAPTTAATPASLDNHQASGNTATTAMPTTSLESSGEEKPAKRRKLDS